MRIAQGYFELFLTNPDQRNLQTSRNKSTYLQFQSHTNKTYLMYVTQLEKQGKLISDILNGPLHMDLPVLADPQEPIHIYSVQAQLLGRHAESDV